MTCSGGLPLRKLTPKSSTCHVLANIFFGIRASVELNDLHPSSQPAYNAVNTGPLHLPGAHWLALTVVRGGKATFSDSFGFSPDFKLYPKSILHFPENQCGIKTIITTVSSNINYLPFVGLRILIVPKTYIKMSYLATERL